MKSPALLLAFATTLSCYAAESSTSAKTETTPATVSIAPYVVTASTKAPDLKPAALDLKKELASNLSMKPALAISMDQPAGLPTLGSRPAAPIAEAPIKLADIKPAQLLPGQKPTTPAAALNPVAEIETKKSESHPK